MIIKIATIHSLELHICGIQGKKDMSPLWFLMFYVYILLASKTAQTRHLLLNNVEGTIIVA